MHKSCNPVFPGRQVQLPSTAKPRITPFGCLVSLIAFFANLGIAFSVVALPFAGLPYKFISLALILIGLFWTYREIEFGKCKIKPEGDIK